MKNFEILSAMRIIFRVRVIGHLIGSDRHIESLKARYLNSFRKTGENMLTLQTRTLTGQLILGVAAWVTLLALSRTVAGDLEPLLQRCCVSGELWASNHTTCDGPPYDSLDIPPDDKLACLTALYICCVRAHRRESCERGKQAALNGRPCVPHPTFGGEAYKDCCDGCTLGLRAGSVRMPCALYRFNFGSPWDEAFAQCCQTFSSVQGTSPLNGKSRCETSNPCEQLCKEVGDQIQCSCSVGYRLGPDQRTCHDIDECIVGSHSCNPTTELCINSVGGFQCLENTVGRPGQCPPGYVWNQETLGCDDVDECLLGVCPADQVCLNRAGSFTCVPRNSSAVNNICPAGFRFNSNSARCIDVDECLEGLDKCERGREICQNSHGAYQCITTPSKNRDCPAGFKWNENKDNCEDVDECGEGLDNCDEQQEDCRNTMGGYECDARCPFMMRFDPAQAKCIDLDSCAEGLHNCKADETCLSTSGGFVCVPKPVGNQCQPGFKPITSAGGVASDCEDVDECVEFPDVCESQTETCVNAVGSYDCVPAQKQDLERCGDGFRRDETSKRCVDVDECAEGLDRCDQNTQDCVNSNGSHECVVKQQSTRCPPGYKPSEGTSGCEDINECLDGRHKCLPGKEQCVNVAGAYRCQPITQSRFCPPGMRFSNISNICQDVDECAEGSHACNPANQNCVNAVGSYRCVNKATCPHGYAWSRQGNKCEDVNECAEGSDDCDRRTQYCVNTVGSYQCQTKVTHPVQRCGTGYRYDAGKDECIDLNECDVLQPCLNGQTCENTLGSYKCSCPTGWTIDTITRQCKDVNECQLGLHSCAVSQRCDNTIGSFTCVRTTSCGTGYTLNAAISECEDDDECQLGTHNCGPGFACRNTPGSFRCDRVQCPPGQKLLSDGSCKVVICGRGMEHDDAGNCIDINECSRSDVCRNNQRCINSVGSYRCQNLLNCGAGYELNEFGNQCVDVDECARRIDECKPQQTCRNRPGGYMCDCPRGYTLNANRECEDVDECTRFRGQVCSSVSDCVNTQGSYVCNCKEGFRKAEDDKNCLDVDECTETPNICHQTCNNVWGSYQCSCKQGYTLGSDNRSCQDIDECKMWEGRGNLCIGFCVNEPGSYSCSCPDGYRLSPDKRTCQDIDECEEQSVCNGDKEVCLNTRGGFKCNRIACPPNYVRDKDHRNRQLNSEDTIVCRKKCAQNDVDCILNETQSVTFQALALPAVPFLPQPLILTTMRAIASGNPTLTFQSDYQILDGNDEQLFDILKGQGVGSLRLTRPIHGPKEMLLRVLMAIHITRNPRHPSFTSSSHHMAIIQIFVSEYDF